MNLSARQFELQTVPTWSRARCATSGLPPRLLELELTESIPTGPATAPWPPRCSELDAHGGALLDRRLRHRATATSATCTGSPITTVKLDKSFVAHRRRRRTDSPIVRAVIALATAWACGSWPRASRPRTSSGSCRSTGATRCRASCSARACPPAPCRHCSSAASADDPWTRLPWLPAGDVEEWDEKRLQEALWASHGAGAASGRRPGRPRNPGDGHGHRQRFHGAADAARTGSAGGLPPEVQVRWTSAVSSAGLVTGTRPGRPAGDVLASAGSRDDDAGRARRRPLPVGTPLSPVTAWCRALPSGRPPRGTGQPPTAGLRESGVAAAAPAAADPAPAPAPAVPGSSGSGDSLRPAGP